MAVTPTVQRAGLGRVFTADYWRGMSQGRHVNALNEQLAHERDTQSLLRSNPQGLQETRRHVLKLLSPQIKHLRAALQTTTASLGDAGAQPVGNYDRTKLAPADVTSATYAYIDALAPLLFPPDAGYVKGALLDLLVAVCGPARGRKDWRLGTAQNAPRSTGTEAVQQIVIDVLFLRSQMRVLGEESAKLGTSTVAGRALIDATAVLQSVANDAPAAGKRAPWLEREARRCLPARAAFFDTLLDRILTRYNARFLAGKAPAYARPLPPRPAQG
jgi:hypothetical protein